LAKAETLSVPISSVFTTLQSYLGTNYVGDFNFLGRTYQVNLQGDAAFRSDPNQALRMYTAIAPAQAPTLGSDDGYDGFHVLILQHGLVI
jgi:multidrug efflux pump subunit AcrB